MLKLRSREEQKMERLNLVPIMDAVFIFIFFLLFSAQFIKIYQLETQAPIISTIPSDKKFDKEPLSLKIKLSNRKIDVFTGVISKLEFSLYLDEANSLQILSEKLLNLRKEHPQDDEAIIAPDISVSYRDIINVIESVQKIPEGLTLSVDKDGEVKNLKKIFSNVVLEPLE